MCVMTFIASDKELPTIEWNNEVPDFYVHNLKEPDYGYKEIRSILCKRYLYNVGAHTGCGCGFSYGIYEPLDEDDIQEDLKGKSSVNKLFQYIRENLQICDSIELFSCWAGNEGVNPKSTYELNINQIELSDSFCFVSDNELRIIKA